jgi:hypothetical protein
VAYESEMSMFFDVVQKTMLVFFRGKFTVLVGPYSDRQAGVAAGEA